MMQPRTFTVTEDHIKLLRRAEVVWEDCEYGAPAIDCKRPYGNSSVEQDIAEILGMKDKSCPHCGEMIASSDADLIREIHKGTMLALQIFLCVGYMKPGTYTNKEPYGKGEWEPVKE